MGGARVDLRPRKAKQTWQDVDRTPVDKTNVHWGGEFVVMFVAMRV